MVSIRRDFFKGIFYSAVTKYIGIITSIIIGAILARLLSPSEFGTVALIIVFISFFNIFTDVGIGTAIIQNKELTEKDLESIFLFSIFLGFFLSFIFFLSSHFIAFFYNENILTNLVQLLSLTILFSALRIVPYALLLKSYRFKEIGFATITVQLLSGVFAVILAYKGFSYFALVYKSIFDSFFMFFIFYYLQPIKVKFQFKIIALKKIFHYSAYQFLFNFVNYFSRNLDNLLIGKFIGPLALGLYDKSYQLMTLPVQNLTNVITPVLHPVLSNFQNDKTRIYEAYLRVVNLLAIVGFPLSIFLFFCAPEIIHLMYGSQWNESIPVFRILALTVGIQMVLSSSGSIFQALNLTKMLFYSGLLSAVTMICAIYYGIFVMGNIVSIGYGLLIAFIVNFFQAFYLLINIGFNKNYYKFLIIFCYPIFISFLIALGLYFFGIYYTNNNIVSLLFKILISTSIFISMFLARKSNRIFFKTSLMKFIKK